MADSYEAQFNMGLASIMRIDKLLTRVSDAFMGWDLRIVYDTLPLLENELHCYLLPEEVDEIEEIRKKVNFILTHHPKVLDSPIYNPIVRGNIYELLIKWDRLLRKLMNNHGMLMPPKYEEGIF